MTTLLWVAGLIVIIPIGWFLLKITLAILVPPEKSGREFLKQQVKTSGVDITRIPDSAWNEIFLRSIGAAKGMAMLNDIIEYRNWRENLVRLLEGEAVIVAEIMNDETGPLTSGATRDTLERHGVIGNKQWCN